MSAVLQNPPLPPVQESPGLWALAWRRLRQDAVGMASLVVVVFFFRSGSFASRLAIGILYAAAFIPLTYWIDRLAYRNYLRRSGKAETS